MVTWSDLGLRISQPAQSDLPPNPENSFTLARDPTSPFRTCVAEGACVERRVWQGASASFCFIKGVWRPIPVALVTKLPQLFPSNSCDETSVFFSKPICVGMLSWMFFWFVLGGSGALVAPFWYHFGGPWGSSGFMLGGFWGSGGVLGCAVGSRDPLP